MSTLLPILPAEDVLDKTSKLSPAAQQAEEEKNRMRRYFEHPEAQLGPTAHHEPICLYLETTNRCNLLCTTCPRTYEQLEPEADMPWELFTSLIDQCPNIARVVLHGVGEPMLVKDLAQRVAYLKARNIYVLLTPTELSSQKQTAVPSSKPALTSYASPSTPPKPASSKWSAAKTSLTGSLPT